MRLGNASGATVALVLLAIAAGVPTLAASARTEVPVVQTGGSWIAGTWWITDYSTQLAPAEGSIPFTPAGRAAFERNRAAHASGTLVDTGVTKCLPQGTTRTLFSAYPMQIVPHGDFVTFVHEVNHTFWSVSLTGGHPTADDLDPAFMGDSVGRWRSGAFEIDTIGFKPDSFLDDSALPHGDRLHVATRIRRVSANVIEIAATVKDPDYFTAPFTVRHRYERRPDVVLQEYVCREEHRALTGSRRAGVQLRWVAKP